MDSIEVKPLIDHVFLGLCVITYICPLIRRHMSIGEKCVDASAVADGGPATSIGEWTNLGTKGATPSEVVRRSVHHEQELRRSLCPAQIIRTYIWHNRVGAGTIAFT